MEIIGRNKEIAQLNELYNSKKAEFVVVYGRRRVGKTFLIDAAMEGKITFRHAGLSPIEEEEGAKKSASGKNAMKRQLKHFYQTLQMHGMRRSHCPASWSEAFMMLAGLLTKMDDGGRLVVFIDELPWMDTPRSEFVTALEGFWNNWACHRPNMMFIGCGSATSWILDNLIDNYGGLYGRVCREIHLRPFTLHECELFYKHRGVRMSRYDIAQSYMVLGGIPYYMNYVDKGMSIGQAIDAIFFNPDCYLRDEYNRLFASGFRKPEQMKAIVEVLFKRHAGWTRKEIVKKSGLNDNGDFSKLLKALVASDFAVSYLPIDGDGETLHYKLVDPFCWFWLHFVKGHSRTVTNYWQSVPPQSVVSWRGYAFEELCWSHWMQIKSALGVAGVTTELSGWAQRGDDEVEGSQVDLIMRRRDHIVNMCEMKYYGSEFVVTKNYHQKLLHRQTQLEGLLDSMEVIHPTLVTTKGLKYNEYSNIFQNTITLDDLFKE